MSLRPSPNSSRGTSMSRVLVTGGKGFIGSAVSRTFLSQGFEVRAIDTRPSEVPGVETYVGSIMDEYNLLEAMEGCEYVVHLAAMLGVKRTEVQRLGCLQVNIQGTKNVLDACVKQKIKKIVFSSSSEVYGEPSKVPIAESDPKQPISIYATTKLAGEEYLRAYKQQYDLDYTIVRFFNVYGPGQVAEFVVPRFIKQVQLDMSPTVYGAGSQVRAFCNVRDAAQGVYLALVNKAADDEDFNIGNPNTPVTMEELAKLIVQISGKDLEPTRVSMQDADRTESRDIHNRAPDISKAQRILGYRPTVDLHSGLTEMYESEVTETWFEPLVR